MFIGGFTGGNAARHPKFASYEAVSGEPSPLLDVPGVMLFGIWSAR